LEIGWLEDFLAVVDHGGFAKAAERSGISQPAFSRRIRALEEWLSAPLLDRSTHRTSLTPAGERFKPVAEELLRTLRSSRDELRAVSSGSVETLRFASTHGLSLTFFPAWLKNIEYGYPLKVTVQLTSDHMVRCEKNLVQGHAQFLLCHYHVSTPTCLTPDRFRSITVGRDTLIPVSAPDATGAPAHPLPGSARAPVAHLAYTCESGVGRILGSALQERQSEAHLDRVFSTHLVTALTAMARDGRGLAWVPASMVADDLEAGRLVRAGSEQWDVDAEIRIYRARSRQSQAAEQFWSHLVALDRAAAPTG
jgi:LysR family transcriptional regulator, hypochlorite-specific transcription factor HypT